MLKDFKIDRDMIAESYHGQYDDFRKAFDELV